MQSPPNNILLIYSGAVPHDLKHGSSLTFMILVPNSPPISIQAYKLKKKASLSSLPSHSENIRALEHIFKMSNKKILKSTRTH